MYKNIKDTVSYLQDLESLTKDISRDEIELFIIPSYTTLDSASKAIDQKNIRLGAQNMCWEEQGQFTGEISPLMLQEAGIGLVMIGHSERRHVFGETDMEENKKFSAHCNTDSRLFYVSERLQRKKNSASAPKCSVHS